MIHLKKSDVFINPERVSAIIIVNCEWTGNVDGYKLIIDGKIVVIDKEDEPILVKENLINWGHEKSI